MADDTGDYQVGFGRPPKESQFKKGESGNRAGRPKRRTLRGELEEELQVMVVITEHGRKVRMTKARAFWLAVLAKAVGGDMRAAALIANTVGVMPELDPSNDNTAATEDQAVLEEFRQREAERLKRLQDEPEEEPADG